MKLLIVDALASGKGTRKTTRDVIGAGPRAVAGVLEARGIETKIIPVNMFLDGRFKTGFDALLVSGMTSDHTAVQKTARQWRRRGKGHIILGGPVCSEPEKALRKTDADVAVTGEGEESISELLDAGLGHEFDDLSEIRGISFKDRDGIHVNPLRPVQGREFYEKFSPSTQRITDYPLYHAARVYVEVLRGCSNFHRARIGPIGESCTFCEQCTEAALIDRYECPIGVPPGCGYCSVPSLYGPPRTRPSKLILEEAKELLSLGVRRLVLSAPGFLDYGRDLLVDPEPLTDPRSPEPNYEAVEELLSSLTELPEASDGYASVMIENMKAALVTERASKILGKYLAGTPVSVGFETGSDDHSVKLGRPDTPSETIVALKRLKSAGLKPYVYFIHGLPGQTKKTVHETVKRINESMKLGAERIILYRFQSLPMSAFTDCPSGPPAAKDPLSGAIYTAAQEANRESKKHQLGKTMRVIVAESYDRDKSLNIAYPLYHGPVVLVEGAQGLIGDVIDVKITGVASDRMVRAHV
ncbi:MAG: B12-binding domain-containing radical SAM protein [Candidatus Bathyarchaeota archaeon]|nr:B12-binding domain-containing radical SAM protein [Candidatus Bathyarchaeota archaeon]